MLSNVNVSGTDGWSCVPMRDVEWAVKTTYYVTRALRWLETAGVLIPK